MLSEEERSWARTRTRRRRLAAGRRAGLAQVGERSGAHRGRAAAMLWPVRASSAIVTEQGGDEHPPRRRVGGARSLSRRACRTRRSKLGQTRHSVSRGSALPSVRRALAWAHRPRSLSSPLLFLGVSLLPSTSGTCSRLEPLLLAPSSCSTHSPSLHTLSLSSPFPSPSLAVLPRPLSHRYGRSRRFRVQAGRPPRGRVEGRRPRRSRRGPARSSSQPLGRPQGEPHRRRRHPRHPGASATFSSSQRRPTESRH